MAIVKCCVNCDLYDHGWCMLHEEEVQPEQICDDAIVLFMMSIDYIPMKQDKPKPMEGHC